jgi:hypothetical protein
LLFQASLAAGGVALMPFNYLQYGIDHGKGLITWAKIPWDTMTGAQYALYLPLIALMLAFTVLHFGLTGYFLWRLAKWLGTPGLTTLYLIRDYFLTYFRRSDFAPPQWGLV